MEPQKSRFWDVVQTLAAYVAVPVALLYPVGFFALFFQFMNYYFLDFYTAWYAAALVNRMVAIQQGVNVFALALIASVVLSAIVNRFLFAHDEGNVPGGVEPPTVLASLKAATVTAVTLRGFERRGWLKAKLICISLAILGLYIVYSRIVAGGRPTLLSIRGRLSTECADEQIARHQLALWPDSLVPATIFLVGCLWGGWLIYRFRQAYRRRPDADPASERGLANAILDSVTEGWILPGLAVAYAFSVFASIVLAWHTPSFAPYMTYGPTVEHRGEPSTENAFLSHTAGQWYFLHRIPKDDDEDPEDWTPPDYTVVSLGEGEVKYVRIRPIPPRVSRVAPLLGEFGEKPLEEDPCK